MMKAIAYVLLLTALVTGCARMRDSGASASPASPDPSMDKVSCEASGGKWNALTRNCDR
jgi:hypothetical protein